MPQRHLACISRLSLASWDSTAGEITSVPKTVPNLHQRPWAELALELNPPALLQFACIAAFELQTDTIDTPANLPLVYVLTALPDQAWGFR